MSQKWTRAQIMAAIETNPNWLERGIVAIYNKQVQDEKRDETTKYHNRVGFRPNDAKRLSYYAKWIISGHHISGHHVNIAKVRMRKYCRQLAKIANGEI